MTFRPQSGGNEEGRETIVRADCCRFSRLSVIMHFTKNHRRDQKKSKIAPQEFKLEICRNMHPCSRYLCQVTPHCCHIRTVFIFCTIFVLFGDILYVWFSSLNEFRVRMRGMSLILMQSCVHLDTSSTSSNIHHRLSNFCHISRSKNRLQALYID